MLDRAVRFSAQIPAVRRRRAACALALVLLLPLGADGCALLVAGGVAGGAAGAATAARESEDERYGAGTYVGAVVLNVFYFPAKVLFAGGGAVASGITYLVTVGNRSATNRVWRTAVNGNYVLTPRMVEGREPVRFIGS